ncbi:hypothetical protein CMI42_04740 [Candidatus Pacearchaeota archaeon]|nr:hypothetical protein [Candidatus Pacearchaeota archaeon]|tara:strand:+ start:340 stop:606 length:267 start_codon:yes stop_codon:yes gene_type:complete
MNKEYEKQKAKEMLDLINRYEESEEKRELNEKLYNISDELYNKNREKLSQQMIDVSLAVFSFTQAAMSGGPLQPLDEFIPDLKDIIYG